MKVLKCFLFGAAVLGVCVLGSLTRVFDTLFAP